MKGSYWHVRDNPSFFTAYFSIHIKICTELKIAHQNDEQFPYSYQNPITLVQIRPIPSQVTIRIAPIIALSFHQSLLET